jgi:PAS domain S-box-containing protein
MKGCSKRHYTKAPHRTPHLHPYYFNREKNPVNAGRPQGEIPYSEVLTPFKKIKDTYKMAMMSMDLTGVGIFWITNHANFAYVNDTVCRMLGYTREEMLKMNVADIDPAYSRERLKETWLQLKKNGKFHIETVHKTRDGRLIPVEVYGTYVCYRGMECNIAISHDISERKQAEELIHSSEQRLSDIINSLPDATYVIDADGRVIAWNKAIEELTGVSARDILGHDDYEYAIPFYGSRRPLLIDCALHPDICTGKYYEFVEKQGSILITERFFPSFRGRRAWLWVKATPLYDSHGNVIGGIEAIRDTTERKDSQDALKESEERFRGLAESTNDIVWEMDANGHFTYVNGKVQELFGVDPRDSIGKPPTRFIVPKDKEKMEAFAADHLKNPRPFTNFENTHVGPNGHRIYLESNGAPFFDTDGNLKGYRGIARDATDRKMKEEEIRHLNEELEQRVKDRTRQYEIANRELEAFSYSVSHDLRSPLRSINGFSQALLDGYLDKLDEQGRDFLQRIIAASKRMSQLIDDLLQLSRVTRLDMIREKVNLSEMAESIAASLRETEPDRQVTFVIEPNILADGDPRLLQIVLENLLGNAWKFTSHHPKATIEFNKTLENNTPVYFVKDDGAGFDMQYAGKLFSPFQRMHKTEEFSGTGVGLATVQRIIYRHGGKVWALGEVEKGATVSFTLGENTEKISSEK